MEILIQIQQMMGELQCKPENFIGSIIFMSLFHYILWDSKPTDDICGNNSKTITEYAERFPCGHWSFLGPGSEKNWYGTYDRKPDGSWDRTAQRMLPNFTETEHPVFVEPVSWRERRFKKGSGKKSMHFNGSNQNIELLLQMVISVNQLSIYGAVADMTE